MNDAWKTAIVENCKFAVFLASFIFKQDFQLILLIGKIQSTHIATSMETNEPRHEKKRLFAYAKTKTQISFAVTGKLISAFVFATRIVQSLYFLNLKFQASSHLLWSYSLVCVGPRRKPRRPVFSQRGSNHVEQKLKENDHKIEICCISVICTASM